jgi:hypothetical protein
MEGMSAPDLNATEAARAEALEARVHEIVREEIASLAGLALRRLQDENFTRSIQGNMAAMKAKEVIGHFWGEVLSEYGSEEA